MVMNILSFEFIIFISVVFLLTMITNGIIRKILLLISNIFFLLSFGNFIHLFWLVITSIFTYVMGILINKNHNKELCLIRIKDFNYDENDFECNRYDSDIVKSIAFMLDNGLLDMDVSQTYLKTKLKQSIKDENKVWTMNLIGSVIICIILCIIATMFMMSTLSNKFLIMIFTVIALILIIMDIYRTLMRK